MESMDIVGNSKEDATLPKATMFKIIKEMLPQDVRVARDAQDLLVECCVEFINLVSSESNEVCSKEDKRTIAPEHVLKALEGYGKNSLLSTLDPMAMFMFCIDTGPKPPTMQLYVASRAEAGNVHIQGAFTLCYMLHLMLKACSWKCSHTWSFQIILFLFTSRDTLDLLVSSLLPCSR
ncbi:hypothetical protein IFM89_020118 [Coptis chinensis]|uniref:Transcription factor CBF/NF-Y/archaeal histone domain-containing protein n=1 Tax=Coptis chinensis TaxID=261450 RepID=A0A835J120_9MAGN|nr:hypothetical protein IFM89_020118 [Coptis chinensis]